MEENDKKTIEKNLKIILLGESGVGKTSIILRYFKNEFNENMKSTFGSTFITQRVLRGNIIYKINVWDTTGQEKYRSVTKLFLQGADIAILVYSIDKSDTFKKIDYWRTVIKDNCDENIILAVVGNKTDLFNNEDVDPIPDEDGEKYAKGLHAIFRLVSAKIDKKGIDSLFNDLLEEYIKSGNIRKSDLKEMSVKIEEKKVKKKHRRSFC